MTTDDHGNATAVVEELRAAHHGECFACTAADRSGLGLEFRVIRPGSVEGDFECSERLQSYDGILHGGMICLLLDAAMTHCGFSMGRTMVTGDLHVRFVHPVPTRTSILIRAWVDEPSDVLQVVHGEITLDGMILARATGRFVDKDYGTPCPRN